MPPLMQSDSIFTPVQNLETELNMLEAMYPEQMKWIGSRREVVYNSEDSQSTLTLRIPDDYLVSTLPEVIIATIHKDDVRDRMQDHVKQCEVGIEILDLLVDAFRELVVQVESASSAEPEKSDSESTSEAKRTVVIWLHHLLNTSKRKQALAPPLASVSGVTKPGYPGVLVYAGPEYAVDEHVKSLRALNWQAFQLRLEVPEEWRFVHGDGVIELESMAEIVAEVGPDNKAIFLQAMNIA